MFNEKLFDIFGWENQCSGKRDVCSCPDYIYAHTHQLQEWRTQEPYKGKYDGGNIDIECPQCLGGRNVEFMNDNMQLLQNDREKFYHKERKYVESPEYKNWAKDAVMSFSHEAFYRYFSQECRVVSFYICKKNPEHEIIYDCTEMLNIAEKMNDLK